MDYRIGGKSYHANLERKSTQSSPEAIRMARVAVALGIIFTVIMDSLPDERECNGLQEIRFITGSELFGRRKKTPRCWTSALPLPLRAPTSDRCIHVDDITGALVRADMEWTPSSHSLARFPRVIRHGCTCQTLRTLKRHLLNNKLKDNTIDLTTTSPLIGSPHGPGPAPKIPQRGKAIKPDN